MRHRCEIHVERSVRVLLKRAGEIPARRKQGIDLEAGSGAIPAAQARGFADMTPEHMRDIFAEELERCGEPGLARMVRSGYDNSNGGALVFWLSRAARAAMARVADEAVEEFTHDAKVAKAIAGKRTEDVDFESVEEAEAETVPLSADVPITITERTPSDHV